MARITFLLLSECPPTFWSSGRVLARFLKLPLLLHDGFELGVPGPLLPACPVDKTEGEGE